MPHDVFISYASRDKSTADAVCHALEAEGVRCWIAPRDAQPGQKYQGSLVRAIRSCRAVVLVFSEGANASEHVTREVSIAADAGKPVVPFRIEAVEMSDELCYYISSVHWLDALTPPVEAHIERLVQAVTSLVPHTKTESVRTIDGTEQASGSSDPRRSKRSPGLATQKGEFLAAFFMTLLLVGILLRIIHWLLGISDVPNWTNVAYFLIVLALTPLVRRGMRWAEEQEAAVEPSDGTGTQAREL
jgi:hypothetical protein